MSSAQGGADREKDGQVYRWREHCEHGGRHAAEWVKLASRPYEQSPGHSERRNMPESGSCWAPNHPQVPAANRKSVSAYAAAKLHSVSDKELRALGLTLRLCHRRGHFGVSQTQTFWLAAASFVRVQQSAPGAGEKWLPGQDVHISGLGAGKRRDHLSWLHSSHRSAITSAGDKIILEDEALGRERLLSTL
jgi:hypothetical protein